MVKFWTTEKIKEGFDRFKSKHGRLPTAPEVDQLAYLPSSRYIQKAFGGLTKLRTQLGYKDNHFGKGIFRRRIASLINSRGRIAELNLEKVLRKNFGEVFVHTEKFFDNSKNRVDFYIYSPDGNFGVDIFYTDSIRYLQSIINIKMIKYERFPCPLFFVAANKDFKQNELDRCVDCKIKFLPKNIQIVTLNTFLEFIKSKKVYPDPLTYELK